MAMFPSSRRFQVSLDPINSGHIGRYPKPSQFKVGRVHDLGIMQSVRSRVSRFTGEEKACAHGAAISQLPVLCRFRISSKHPTARQPCSMGHVSPQIIIAKEMKTPNRLAIDTFHLSGVERAELPQILSSLTDESFPVGLGD